MPRHFEEGLGQIQEKTLRLGGLVETMVDQALSALGERDPRLAQAIFLLADQAYALEADIDHGCVGTLALFQPAAGNVRFITTAMKISTDLRRMADQAVNISQRAMELTEGSQLEPHTDIPMMGQLAKTMMQDGLDAFVRRDGALARKVIESDTKLDTLKKRIFHELLTLMLENPRTITHVAPMIRVSGHLERMGDHATNIAELVVFLVEGKSIRHEPPIT